MYVSVHVYMHVLRRMLRRDKVLFGVELVSPRVDQVLDGRIV